MCRNGCPEQEENCCWLAGCQRICGLTHAAACRSTQASSARLEDDHVLFGGHLGPARLGLRHRRTEHKHQLLIERSAGMPMHIHWAVLGS